MITTKVKGIYTTSMDNLELFIPQDPETFCISVRVMAGPTQSEGKDAFDIRVCSPRWLEQEVAKEGFVFGMQTLFIAEYNAAQIKRLLTKMFERHMGNSWEVIGQKLTRIAHWEFED